MIEIFKSGDESKAEYTLFECEECGCKWRASIRNYRLGWSIDISKLDIDEWRKTKSMRCPNCGRWVEVEAEP